MASFYTIGHFELRPTQRVLLSNGRPCRIGGRAFDILVHLVQNRHRTVSQQELLDHVWPGLAVEPNNLQVQIWTVRRIVGRASIVTVPRGGYRFVAPVTEDVLAAHARAQVSPTEWRRTRVAASGVPLPPDDNPFRAAGRLPIPDPFVQTAVRPATSPDVPEAPTRHDPAPDAEGTSRSRLRWKPRPG